MEKIINAAKAVKRVFLPVLLLGLLVSFVGCSSGKDPQKVAMDYLTASFTFDYKTKDENSVVSEEVLTMASLEGARQSYDMTEEETWEMLAEWYSFDAVPKNYEEYAAYMTAYVKQELADRCGEDASVKVSCIGSEEMDQDDINDILKEASDYFDKVGVVVTDIVDFTKIKQCEKVTCKIYLSGEKVEPGSDEAVSEASVFVVKIDGRWKVLNFGLAS